MVEHLKDFLLTIFFIFSPLVFYPYIYKFKNNVVLYRFLLSILFSLILIIIMSLPININGVIYDFRSVPAIIGSLYGGPIVSVILFSVLVIYRWILGNPNTLLYIVSLLPAFIIVLIVLKKYNPLKMVHKILLAVILCSMMKLLTISTYLIFMNSFDKVTNNLLNTVETYLVQAIIVGSCVYFIELLNKYIYMQDEIYKSEKIKMVSEMAASVAHEIRNPLTTVKGFIQLLGAEQIDTTKKEYYQRICLDELERADLIISDYLSLAKTDVESIDQINVKDEVYYLENVLLTYANYNNVECNTSVIGENMFITGSKYKFRQALINIGKNAIESMEDGGLLEIKAIKRNGKVMLQITDNGVGMTPVQVSRLGTPYYSTKEKGTGLGTMVSFAIIKKMNGKIQIKSEEAKGTQYTFIFPAS